jgi:hypothetical protein
MVPDDHHALGHLARDGSVRPIEERLDIRPAANSPAGRAVPTPERDRADCGGI